MAIFGILEVVKEQLSDSKFKQAFDYLEQVIDTQSKENKRLLSLPLDAFEKVDIDNHDFALEQVYNTKDRDNCFFESHKQYIDVQFILEGQEIIEVVNSSNLIISQPYSEEMDLIKYHDANTTVSPIVLQQGDVAIFFPKDAHMPCVKLDSCSKVVKTVVKVKV